MWTLGIETSSREGSVSLLHGNDVLVAERPLSHEGRRHARTLVHELKQLLAESRLSPSDCDVIAVSRGPGSFTGLRVGVVCAKTWAYATGCRLVGVDTLLAIASSVDPHIGRVEVVADAQRGDLYWGQYHCERNGIWTAESEVCIVSVDDWMRERTKDLAVTGPAIEQLRDRIPDGMQLLPEATWQPSSVEVGRIGSRLAASGQTVSHWSLEPLYLRKSAAEEKANATAK